MGSSTSFNQRLECSGLLLRWEMESRRRRLEFDEQIIDQRAEVVPINKICAAVVKKVRPETVI